MKVLSESLAVVLVVGVLAWSLDLFRAIGIVVYTEQFLAGLVALALPLVYLTVPASRDRVRTESAPWYDQAAAAVAFGLIAYTVIRFPQLSELIAERPWDGFVVAALACLLLLEALRRTSGKTLVIVVVFFIALALVGHWLPGELAGRRVSLVRLTYFVYWDASAMFGSLLNIVATIVIAFVFFGNVLFKTGGGAWFTDVAMALMGRFRGGTAKIAILASSLFGTISGSVVANVVTTGVITIPMMKKDGFSKEAAGAVEAVASTGGQLMPPIMGIAAFLMAEFLGISYATVAVAAIIPSLLFYIAVFIQTDMEAVRNGITRVPQDRIPKLSRVLKDGWHFPIPFIVLIYTLFVLHFEPERAAMWASGAAIAGSLLFGFRGHRLNAKDVYWILLDTGRSALELLMIGVAAGVVVSVLNYTGLGFALTLSLVHLSGGFLFVLLLLAAVACIILGMGMPTPSVYILVATLIAPALVEMKIDPLAAHMFIMYYGCLSMITPPVAIGAFAAANIAGGDPMRTGWVAVRFGWVAFLIPFLFVYSATLLMIGDPVWVAIDFLSAVVGIWLVTSGIMGVAFRPVGLVARIYYGATGLALVIPVGAFDGSRIINVVGAGLALALFLYEANAWRRATAASLQRGLERVR